jgi:prevent-host-death family protein
MCSSKGTTVRAFDPHSSPNDLALPEEIKRGNTLIHTLYRFFNGQGRLLYVGITAGDPNIRWSRHQRMSPWWDDVSFVHVEHLHDREEARVAELAAIRMESPLHNVADRPGWNPSGEARKLARRRLEELAGESLGPCVTATEVRMRLKEFVNEVCYGGPPVTITRHNKPVAAIVSPEDWELLLEIRRRRALGISG